MEKRYKLLNDFVKDCELRGMTKSATRSYRVSLTVFHKFLESQDKNILEVEKGVLRDYIDYLMNERKVRIKTIENHFSAMSSFFEYLVFEDYVKTNPVLSVRKRYLRHYKKNGNNESQTRKLISVEEMSMLINSVINARDRAVLTVLAKTGIRRGELVAIDVNDVDLTVGSIRLKPAAKRSNRTVFFDDEARRVLSHWLSMRRHYARPDIKALFVTTSGSRLNRNGVYDVVTTHAKRLGLHDPASDRLEDHLTPHCFRHWFTTHLRRAGMPRDHIKELRGDVRGEAMDIYYHIDEEELRRSYLAFIPKLDIM